MAAKPAAVDPQEFNPLLQKTDLAKEDSTKLKFLPPKAEFLLSNSRKRGSAFCLRFDLINQFDGAFLPYR